MKTNKKIYIVRAAILIIPILGWFYYNYFFLSSNKSPLASEYLNMAPGVKFVGDEFCSDRAINTKSQLTCESNFFGLFKHPICFNLVL